MAILGQPRQIRSAKSVAEDRKIPRPIRVLVLAYHEDEKGKRTLPMIERHFWVVAGMPQKQVQWTDSQGKVHTIPTDEGVLDFSNKCVTVQDLEYDAEGTLLTITEVSHEPQYKLNTKAMGSDDWSARRYKFLRGQKFPAMFHLPRFNMTAKKLAGAIHQWQAQADSPEATWIDGKAPSKTQMASLQAEWDARDAARAEKQAVGAATSTGPTDPSELPGEDYDNGIIT